MNEAVFTIQSLADFLQIDEKTVYRMAQSGELPGFKVRRQWRFKRMDIDVWIESQKHSVATLPSETRTLDGNEQHEMLPFQQRTARAYVKNQGP